MDEDTQAYDATLESIKGNIYDLTGVSIMQDADTYKSTYDVLKDIAKVWDKLTDKQRAGTLENLFGKRQANIGSAIIQNFSQAEKAVDMMANSAGSAEQEFAKAQEGISYKLNALKETSVGIWQNLIDSDAIKTGVDTLTGLLGILDKLTSALGTIGTISVAGGIFASSRGFNIFDEIKKYQEEQSLFKKGSSRLDMAKSFSNSIDLFNNGEDIDNIANMTDALKKYLSNCEVGEANVRGFANSQSSLIGKVKNSISEFGGAGNAIKSFASSLASAAITAGAFALVGVAISATLDAIDKQINKQKYLEEDANNAVNKYQETASKLEEVNTQLKENKARIKEIKSQGKLTYTDKAEINKLEKANTLLEEQKKLLKKQKNKDQEDAALKTAKALNNKFAINGRYDGYADILSKSGKEKSKKEINLSNTGNKPLASDYNWVQDDIGNNLQIYKTEKSKMNSKNIKKNSKVYKKAKENVDKAEENLNQNLSDINSALLTMNDSYSNISKKEKKGQSLTSNEKQIKSDYENLRDLYKEVSLTVDPDNYKSLKMSEILDTKDIEFTKDELMSLAKNGGLDALDLTKFDNLNQALKDSGISAKEFKEDVKALVDDDSSVISDHTTRINELSGALDNADDVLKDFNTALEESASVTGMSGDAIQNVKSMFASLDGYDQSTLFENTANGVRLNKDALRELTAEYESNQKLAYANELQRLTDDYNKTTVAIDNCTDAKKKSKLIDQQSSLASQIEQVSQLASQYDGLTSAYSKWESAMSGSEEGDTYDSVRDKLDDIKKLYEDGDVGTNKFRTSAQLMTNKDLTTASIDEVVDAYEKGIVKMERYFKEGTDGTENFLKDVQKVNKEWAHMNDDGTWELNFQSDKDVADALGINVESVQQILRKLSDQGFEVNIETDSATENILSLKEKAEEASQSLKEGLGKKFDIDIEAGSLDDINKQIDKLDEQIKITSDSSDLEDMKSVMSYLIEQKQSLEAPTFMSIDTSTLTGDIQAAVTLLQQYQQAVNEVEKNKKLDIDTADAQKKADKLLGQIAGLSDNTKKAIGIDVKLDEKGIAKGLKDKSINVKEKVEGGDKVKQAGKDLNKIKDKSAKVTIKTSGKKTLESIKKTLKSLTDKTITVTTKQVNEKSDSKSSKKGKSKLRGSAYSGGSTGNWTIGFNGRSLGGEVGRELLVDSKTGRWRTIGDNGAEFFTHNSTDIIFDHEQTEDLLNDGYTNSYGHSFLNGTAFKKGTKKNKKKKKTKTSKASSKLKKVVSSVSKAGSKARGKLHKTSSSRKKSKKSKSSSSSSSRGSGSGSDSSSSDDSSSENSSETFDWVERALNAVDRVVKRLETAINNVYRDWSDRNSKIGEELSQLTAQMNYYQSGYNTYMAKANAVPLAENYKQMVRDGNWSIQDITDENLKSQINEYKQWYDAAMECNDKLEEIRENIGATYKKAFDNIAKEYENRIKQLEASITNLENKFDLSKYQSNGMNDNYLTSQIDLYDAKANQLVNEIANLEQKMREALNSGYVGRYSEGYQEMESTVADLKNQLVEAEKSISETYEKIFDNVTTKYEQQTKYYQSYIDILDKSQTLAATKGIMASESYYENMIKYQQQNIDNMKAQEEALINSLEKAMADGSVKQGSEKWFEFQDAIHGVQEDLVEANNTLEEFKNNIRDIKWDRFDYLQDEISKITEEAKFFEDLFDNETLYDKDTGKNTQYGDAMMGLHAVSYETYKTQAKDYAKAIKELDEAYKDDSLNQDYLNRRDELVKSQREFILNAQDEKKAIKDLIENGYNAQLDALKELISKRKDLLSQEKDLYNYETEIAKKTQNISELQKRYDAVRGDTSEESQKNIQSLKKDLQNAKDELQQTEYEKYISDQQAMLDNLATDFEDWINNRMDTIDGEFEQVIADINSNGSSISETINSAATANGYTLSTAFNDIFNSKDGTLITEFGNRMGTLQTAIDSIRAGVEYMYKQAKAEADRKAAEQKAKEEAERQAREAAERKRQAELAAQQAAAAAAAQQQQQQQNRRNIFTYKADSYPKNRLNISHSVVDALKYVNMDSSFGKRAQYYSALGGSGAYTGSTSQNNWLLSQVRSIFGFAQGGEIGALKSVIKDNGDDSLAINTFKQGEKIIPLNRVPEWDKLIATLPTLNTTLDSSFGQSSVEVGQIQITLPNVKNYQDFKNALIKDDKFNNAVATMLDSKLNNKNSFNKLKFK